MAGENLSSSKNQAGGKFSQTRKWLTQLCLAFSSLDLRMKSELTLSCCGTVILSLHGTATTQMYWQRFSIQAKGRIRFFRGMSNSLLKAMALMDSLCF